MIGPDSSPVVEAVATAGSDGPSWTVLGGWATGSLEGNCGTFSSATAGGTTTVSTTAAIELSADPLPAFCAVASTEPSDLSYHLLNLQHAVDRRGMAYQFLTATA